MMTTACMAMTKTLKQRWRRQ